MSPIWYFTRQSLQETKVRKAFLHRVGATTSFLTHLIFDWQHLLFWMMKLFRKAHAAWLDIRSGGQLIFSFYSPYQYSLAPVCWEETDIRQGCRLVIDSRSDFWLLPDKPDSFINMVAERSYCSINDQSDFIVHPCMLCHAFLSFQKKIMVRLWMIQSVTQQSSSQN